MKKQLSIVVISYDGAMELWKPFSEIWEKYWSFCPYDRLLINQSISCIEDLCFTRIVSIESEPRQAVYRIKKAIEEIDTEYILLMCDDYFLYKTPRKEEFEEIIDLMKKENIFCVHLQNKKKYHGEIILDKIQNDNFLVSGGIPSIYEREFLLALCTKYESCTMREFELQASRWLQNEQYCIKNISNSTFCCYHCVLEGFWRLKPYIWIKHQQGEINFCTYKKPNFFHSCYAFIKAILFNIINIISPKLYSYWTKRYYK